MTTLAVIPARLNASRLPRKPLRLLGGQPLIVRVWRHIQALELFDRVVVATDSGEIAAVVHSAGGECAITASHHPSGTDRVAEVVGRGEHAGVSTVVNVQGDEPFVSGESIQAAMALVVDGRFPVGTVAVHADQAVLSRPDVVKVVAADDGRALYFSRAPIPFLRDEADASSRDALVRQHIGVYAYTSAALSEWVSLPEHPLERSERLEQLRPLAAGIPIGVATVAEAPEGGVDTEEDLARANARWTSTFAGRS